MKAEPVPPAVAGGIERMDPIRYHNYLGLVEKSFTCLNAYYGEIERVARTLEGESMALYVQKFLETIKSLRLKYSFSPAYQARPGVDLADSGFPHYFDINALDSDIATRGERLPKLADIPVLREKLLDLLMEPDLTSPVRSHEEVRKLHWQIAERAFLDSLDLRKQFFRFTPGKLFEANSASFSKEKGRRAYHFSWGCYDSERNRPCVYFMLMTQDESEPPLDKPDNPEHNLFLQTVDNIASRAPEQLLAIAVRLDQNFRTLYPKALKRFCLGPLVSPLLWNGEENETRTPLATALLPVFKQANLAEDDFVLFFSTETIVSDREEKPMKLLSMLGMDKAQQVFHIPKTDQVLLRKGASAYQNYCVLPHRLRQHLDERTLRAIPEFKDAELYAYQQNGEGVTHVG